LENEPINLVIYESGLINGRMEDIWEFITDFSKLSIVAPNNCFPSDINFKKLEKGQKESYFIRTKNGLIELTLEFSSNNTSSKCVHIPNVLLSIEVIELGIIILVNCLQS